MGCGACDLKPILNKFNRSELQCHLKWLNYFK